MSGVLTVKAYDRDDYAFGAFTAIDARRELGWEEQVSEPGAGSFELMNDATPISPGQFVVMEIDGLPVWTMIAEEFDRVAVDRGEGGAQRTTWAGRGSMAVTAEGLIYPTPGVLFPKQVDMIYNWTHPAFDDGFWWTDIQQVTSVELAKTVQSPGAPNGWPIIPWADNMPANEGAQLGSATYVIWAAGDGSISTPMTIGTVYFRQHFTAPWAGSYAFFLSSEGDAFAAIDGVPIASSSAWTAPANGVDFAVSTPVTLAAGDHVLAVSTRTWPQFPGILGLGGVAWALYVPGYPPTLICQSQGTQGDITTTGTDFPSEPPGMTPGNAMILALQQATARDVLTDLALGFTIDEDTAGQPWAVTPTISTKVWTDLLTFYREVSATYTDIRMDPAVMRLNAWNFGTMNTGSTPVDFSPGVNATRLAQHGRFQVANVVVGEYNGGVLEVVDATSVAAYGRKETPVDIGAVDSEFEALRVLTEALNTYKNPREETQVTVDGPVPYNEYGLGDPEDVFDSTDSLVTKRVTAIGVVEDNDTGRVHGTPTLGDALI